MGFAINLYSVDAVSSYQSARRFHDKAAEKPWRTTIKTPTWSAARDDHPFPTVRKRHFGVREENGNIIFRYHNTDVVTWRPDGSTVVETYHSQSTARFIQHFTPFNGFKLHRSGYMAMHGRDRDHAAVPLLGDFTVTPDGDVVPDKPAVFCIDRVKRAEAKKVREESGYTAFLAWRKVMEPLLITKGLGWKEYNSIMRDAIDKIRGGANRQFNMNLAYVDALKDQELWPAIVQSGMTNDQLLKQCVYYAHSDEVYEPEHFPTLQWSSGGRWKNLSGYKIVSAEG